MSIISDGDTILFQGDSITDAGRKRDHADDLGSGYASMAAGRFQALHPEAKVRFLNRGISGNRVKDLKARWRADCLDLEPDVVSILIGINDTWRRYDRDDATGIDAFTADYREILEGCQELGCRIIICEPFVLPVPADRRAWREDLDPRIGAVRDLAAEFAAVYVPFDGLLTQAAIRSGDPAVWAPDGVHPSPAGHALMADAWLWAVDA